MNLRIKKIKHSSKNADKAVESNMHSSKISNKRLIILLVFILVVAIATTILFIIKNYNSSPINNNDKILQNINPKTESQKEAYEGLKKTLNNKPAENSSVSEKSEYYNQATMYSTILNSHEVTLKIYKEGNIDEILSNIDASELTAFYQYCIKIGEKEIATKIIDKYIQQIKEYIPNAPTSEKQYLENRVQILNKQKESL